MYAIQRQLLLGFEVQVMHKKFLIHWGLMTRFLIVVGLMGWCWERSLYHRNCSSRVARTYCTFWRGIVVLYTRWEYLSPFIIFLVAVELSDSHIWWLDIMKMDNLERNLLEFGLLLTMIVNCNLWPKWRAWVLNHPEGLMVNVHSGGSQVDEQ
jgi:hypothetical protein